MDGAFIEIREDCGHRRFRHEIQCPDILALPFILETARLFVISSFAAPIPRTAAQSRANLRETTASVYGVDSVAASFPFSGNPVRQNRRADPR
jgi:hypothetical protein